MNKKTKINSIKEIKSVGIIGAGTMGAGIAQISALKGFDVVLFDIKEKFLQRGKTQIDQFLAKGKIKGKVTDIDIKRVEEKLSTTLEPKGAAQCDLVIEAVPENMTLKKEIFQELETLAPEGTILASNTSSLSVTEIAGVTKNPNRVAGLHFFNPVPIMKLVEIIRGECSAEETIETLKEFATVIGKTPVVAKDTPGFIVNRVARPFYGEALRVLGENGASHEAIDNILKEAGGFKMGPFDLMDMIGLDVNFAVTQSVYEAYFHEPRYKPHIIQRRMVDAGLLGRKAGQGFYNYKPRD